MLIDINKNLPSLHTLTNTESERSKKYFFLLFLFNLTVIFIAILLAVIDSDKLRVYIGILFLIGSFTTIFLTIKHFEKKWYNSRAIAESIKTLAWKYSVGGEPFDIDKDQVEVDRSFLNYISEITLENSEFKELVEGSSVGNKEITENMKKCRALSLDERKAIYLKHRIQDQKNWYSKESKIHKKWVTRYLAAIIGAEFLSAVFSFALNVHFQMDIILANITFVLFSFLQTNQHKELAQAYSVTFVEINIIEAKSDTIKAENDFIEFVCESERAFSREHVLWLARKDAELIKSKLR